MKTEIDFLRGKKLEARLVQLKQLANEHHKQADFAWRGAIEHARKSGEALQEAYLRLGRRGRWGRWVRANFEGSARLAREYRRIYRAWDEPPLREARGGHAT